MIIKTTVNIKESQFVKISSIAKSFNVSVSFIVNSLVKKSIKHSDYEVRLFQGVQYQDRIFDGNDSWHCLPVSFIADLHEKCHDSRKLFKLSASFIISRAIDKYLFQLIQDLKQKNKISDNYSAIYKVYRTQSGYNSHISIIWGEKEGEKKEERRKEP